MLADMFKPSQEPVRILTGLKMIIADGSLPVDKTQTASLLELLDNVINLINVEREAKITSIPGGIMPQLDLAIEMCRKARLSPNNRKEILTHLEEVRHEVVLVVGENQTLKTNHIRVEADAVVVALRAQVKELTALVEQQASYIHNNVKPSVAKATTVAFLAKEQPDRAFGIYTVSLEWIKTRFGSNTYDRAALEAATIAEAKNLGLSQLNHTSFSVRVSISDDMSKVRFSITQANSSIASLMGSGQLFNPLGAYAQGFNGRGGLLNQVTPGTPITPEGVNLTKEDIANWLDAVLHGKPPSIY